MAASRTAAVARGATDLCALSTGAAPGLREIAERLDLTIKLLGTPAEESGGGKTLLLERGVFKAVDLLHQHVKSGRLPHGIVTHGGAVPPLVPANTSALSYLRVADIESLQQLKTRVRACFEAGAVAAGCTHEVTQVSPVYTQFVPDSWLAGAYRAAITGLDRSPLRPEDERNHQRGSTDMGNVSQSLPAIHPTIAIDCGDAVSHQPEFAAACVMPSVDRAGCDGALALALTGLVAAADDAQRDRLIGGVSRRHLASADPAGGAV